MSGYYVGDPCYVIDDARWSDITAKDYMPRIVPGGDFEGLEPRDFCSRSFTGIGWTPERRKGAWNT